MRAVILGMLAVAGRIQNRRNRDVEIRRARQLAIFGVVKGTLQIINIRPDMNSSRERSERPLIRLKRGKTRQAAERKIHFRDIALCTEILNAIREHRVKLRGVDETKEGALRIDAGNNRFAGNFFSVLKHHARDRAILEANPLDFRIRADFRACLLGGFRERPRERAEAATRKTGRANGMSIRSGAKQQHCGRSSGPWAQGISEDSSCRDYRAQQLRLKKLRNKIRNRHGRPAEQIEDAFLAKLPDSAPGLEKIPEVFRTRLVDGRRCHRNDLRQNFRKGFERFCKFRVFRGVLFRKMSDILRCLSCVVIEKHRFTLGCGSENAWVRRKNLAAKPMQLHVAHDISAQRPYRVRQRRSAKARIKLLGDGAAANHFAALEDQGLEPAFGQIECGDQRIVAAAYQNYPLSERHISSPPSNETRQASSSSG